tara:strand:+ start:51460 stop:53040 length:1581 start_codon:yes stop_codon:yes gene_type:complete
MTDLDSCTTERVEPKDPGSGSPALSSPAKQKKFHPRRPLVTTRIGIFFVVTAISMLGLALIAHASPTDVSLQSSLWVIGITVCAFGGLTSMGSVRTLRTIESELRRIADSPQDARSARSIIGADDAVAGWNTLVHDAQRNSLGVTDSHRHAPLDREATTLARAMRGLPIAWVITGPDGSIRYLNPAACGLLGLDETAGNDSASNGAADQDSSDHIGRDLPALIGLRDSENEDASRLLSDLLGNVRMVHARRTAMIGPKQVDLRITRSILDGRTGDGKGLAWVLHDVTQQEIAAHARDQFLMAATHELRTPLNNLHGYAEALQSAEQLDVEHQKEFCNVIVAESRRLGRLVDQMLSVTQMEAGSMIANRHELEVLPVVEYAVEQIAGYADQKQIKIVTSLSAKLPMVNGDRDKLQAALVNLVGNAVKYTDHEGEVLIRASEDEQWVRIDVQDNGRGISPEEQSKVFDKFFRGAEAEQSEERGNGLGLAFAKEVVRLHGGDISVDSTLGEGSTFTMRLPVSGKSRSGI